MDKQVLWQDRKRNFGLPLSFTKYSLDEDCLIRDTGVLTLKTEEIRLYRIQDISLVKTIWDRIFGVGTIVVRGTDASHSEMQILRVKNPDKVRKLLSRLVEESRKKNRMRVGEVLGYTDLDFNSFDEQ